MFSQNSNGAEVRVANLFSALWKYFPPLELLLAKCVKKGHNFQNMQLLPLISDFIETFFALKMPTAGWGYVQEMLDNICLYLHSPIFNLFS